MTIKRVEDLKEYIVRKWTSIHPQKFDTVKVGKNVYLYYVGNDGLLHREVIFRGSLPTVEGLPVLQKELEKKIENAIKKWDPQ